VDQPESGIGAQKPEATPVELLEVLCVSPVEGILDQPAKTSVKLCGALQGLGRTLEGLGQMLR
jgi:hypothetical protein